MNIRINWALEGAMAVILTACFSMPHLVSQAPSPDPKKPTYAELVASVRKGDANVDYAAMRYAYLDSPERKKGKYYDSKERNDVLQKKDFEKALKMANEIFATDFVDINAHLFAAAAYHGLGREEDAKKEVDYARALVKSILDSGDGKTQDTAYVVISVDEEYIVLRFLEIRPGGQSLSGGKNGQMFDVLKGSKDGQGVTMYFNISKFFGKEFD
jgi:hypothetical protein